MANDCLTNIYINGKEEELQNLYQKIILWTNPDIYESGHTSYRNIADRAEIDTYGLSLRGSLEDVDITPGCLRLFVDTAWTPLLTLWVRICDKYLTDGYELFYVAEEPGCELYWTNDPSCADTVILIINCTNCSDLNIKSQINMIYELDSDGMAEYFGLEQESFCRKISELLQPTKFLSTKNVYKNYSILNSQNASPLFVHTITSMSRIAINKRS